MDPTLSVLMPAFNRDRFIGSAVQSVIGQSFTDWELVVVDDGSTDSTVAKVSSFADSRIRVIQLERNCGIANARNRALEDARGRYIAWLDSDDVAKPGRFKIQLDVLRGHPKVGLIGGCATKIDENGRRFGGTRVPPMAPDHIRCRQLLTSAFQQSSIMGRADVLKAHPYDPTFEVCEDVDVCVRISARHETRNIPVILVERRMHEAQVSRCQKDKILAAQARISRPSFGTLGYEPSGADLTRLCALARAPESPPTEDELRWAEYALGQLLSANARSRCVSQSALRAFVSLLMFDRYRRHSAGRTLRELATSPFAGGLFSPLSLSWISKAFLAAMRSASG